MRFSLVPFALLIIPLMEIAAFVLVGGQIGLWATLGLVVVTAIIGSFLLRWQGLSLVSRIQNELAAQRLPAKDMVRGVMLLLAGVMLLTPGFVTDTIGFLLFVPGLQDVFWKFLKSRIQVAGASTAAGFSQPGSPFESTKTPDNDDSVVELDPDDFTRRDDNSPWAEEISDDSTRK
ncbi:MAG: FxsA family protein [Hyphomicrobiales bacterium]